MSVEVSNPPASGGGGGAPSGPAGGDLGGTYPDPTIARDIATPGQAAHYIGTWDVAVAYAAGECVRAWDGSVFKLYQAKKATTGDDPTSVVASWAEVTTPIVMWGTEDPNLTDSINAHGGGIVAPFGSCYIWLDQFLDALPGLLMFSDFEDSTVQGIGYWDPSQYATIDSASDGITAYHEINGKRAGAGQGNAFMARTSHRIDAGDGSAYNFSHAYRGGSGAGDANVTADATIDETAVGTAYAGDTASHHAGGEAHVLPTANGTEAFNEVKAPVDLLEVAGEPAVPAVNIGRLFAIDDGAGHTQLVVKFNDGGRVVLATDGGTLGPIAQSAQTAFNQTANSVTSSVVPAALGAFSGVLLSDVLTVIPTLIDGVNTNRKLINALIDILQSIKAAQ